MSSRISSVLTTFALFSVSGVTDLSIGLTSTLTSGIAMTGPGGPGGPGGPTTLFPSCPGSPCFKSMTCGKPYTKHYISHRFFEKNEIHTISPEVLGHPSLLLDPAGDKKNEHE